jgi:hypothetical protein
MRLFLALVAEQHRASRKCIIRNNRATVRQRVIGALREDGEKNPGISTNQVTASSAAVKQHRALLLWEHEPGIGCITASRSFRT